MFRGRFIAIDDANLRRLVRAKGDPARRRMMEELEEEIADHVDTDKAWYLLYLCFHDIAKGARRDQLLLVFRGARSLHRGDGHVINAIAPGQVPAIASAFGALDHAWMADHYRRLKPGYFRPGDYTASDEQLAYAWHWLGLIQAFFERHRTSGLHIVFSSQFQ